MAWRSMHSFVQVLLTTYNIGLEEDERTKQMVEAVARRVGFQLPKPGANSKP